MSYSPYAHTTATSGRAGFVRLGSGISGNSDGSIVSNATLLGISPSSLGLGNVTNESKATMFTSPTFTGTTTTVGSRIKITNATSSTIDIFSASGSQYPIKGRLTMGGSRASATSDISPLSGYRSGVANSPNLFLEVEEGDVGGITVSPNGTTIYGAGWASGYLLRVIDEDRWQLDGPDYTSGNPGTSVYPAGPIKLLLSDAGDLTVAVGVYAHDLYADYDITGRTLVFYNSNTVEGARINIGSDTSLDLHFGETSSPKLKISATSSTFTTKINANAGVDLGSGALSTYVPLTDWSPTITGGVSTSVLYAKYSRIGNIVHFQMRFADSGTTAPVAFSLPVATSAYGATGTWVYRTSAGTNAGYGSWMIDSTATIKTDNLLGSGGGAGQLYFLSGSYQVV